MDGGTNSDVPGPWVARSRAFANLAIIALPVFMLTAVLLARGSTFTMAIDFRSITPEIKGLAHGTNPYVTDGMQEGGHFLWTVLGGWLLAPLAWMPGGWAVMMALELLGIAAALWLLGVSDWRMIALALAWPATANSFQTANITVLLAVLIAAGWHERGRARSGLWFGLAVGVKLFAWPVFVWLVATRRWRALAVALGVQLVGLLLTLPYVSLVDFARYEQEANRVFSDEAITPYALLLGWGVPGARALAVAGQASTNAYIRQSDTPSSHSAAAMPSSSSAIITAHPPGSQASGASSQPPSTVHRK